MPNHSFPPVADKNCRLLILGSIPGEESLRLQQYYGHPRNAFWRILSEELPEKLYSEKCAFLLSHNIALWDVLKSAERKGSLDSAIRDEVPNDFTSFLKNHPGIQKICFNGKKAQSSFEKHFPGLYSSYDCTSLPSTSPAYTLSFEKKREIWHKAIGEHL